MNTLSVSLYVVYWLSFSELHLYDHSLNFSHFNHTKILTMDKRKTHWHWYNFVRQYCFTFVWVKIGILIYGLPVRTYRPNNFKLNFILLLFSNNFFINEQSRRNVTRSFEKLQWQAIMLSIKNLVRCPFIIG